MPNTTGFVKVAESGRTIDDREIKAQWLIDAAETYSQNVYTANVYPEHREHWESFGTVEALEYSEDEDGVVSLYADFRPNLFWQSEVDKGQKLFTSIAVKEDFVGTGKAYVYSIAATNNPASLGIERLQFSKNTENTLFSEVIEATEMPKKKTKKSFFNFKKK